MISGASYKYCSLLCIVLLALAFGLRVIHLSADAPGDLSWSQGVATDGPWYMESALAKIQTGTWRHSQSYDKPFYTFWAFFLLRLGGIGFHTAGLLNVIPGLLLLLCLALLLRTTHGDWLALMIMVLLGSNYYLIQYSRIPVIYTMMLAWMSISVWLWIAGLRNNGNLSLSLAALATLVLTILYCKEMAAVLLPPFLLTLGYHPRLLPKMKRGQPRLWLAGGIILLAGLLLAFFLTYSAWNPEFQAHMSYRARTYLRLPHSLAELISQLCLFERDAPFFIIQSVLWYAAYAYPLIFIISYQAKDRLQRAVESIFLGWFGLAVLSCALLQYRPSRYMLFIIPPLAVLAALSLTFLADLPAALGRIRLARWHTLLFFFWGIPLLYRWAFPLFEQVKAAYPTSSIPGNEYVRLFGAGLGSALLLLLCATLWRKFGPPPNSVGSESLARAGSFSRTFALALLGLTLIFNGYPYLAWAFQPYYSAYQTSRDLGELLPGSSKLGGGYAHYLSLETTFPADRLAVAAEELCDALENRRVTHILIDTREGVQKIRTPTGEPLPCLRYLHTFYVRGYGIQLYRAISSESKIGPSPFESAMRLSQQKKWAEALPIFQILAAEHPANSTILTRLGIGLWQTGKLREAATNLERANAINGRNPDTLLTLARIYQLESRARDKQQRLLGEAYESALNEPGMKQYITALLKKF